MHKILLFWPNYKDDWFYKDGTQLLINIKSKDLEPEILTFNCNESFPVTEQYLKVIKIDHKKYIWGKLALLFFLFRNARSIKVVMCYHINFGSLFLLYSYKLINRSGFTYLKMDNNHKAIKKYDWEFLWDHRIPFYKIKFFLMKTLFIYKIDLFSIEDDSSKKYFEEKYSFFKDRLILLYNGFTINDNEIEKRVWSERSDHILTVARLGVYEKATDVLLEAFAKTKNKHKWKLILCGSVDPGFKKYIEDFFDRHPDLKEKVILTGYVAREDVLNFYRSAKIFVLPSRSEGFPNVISDALIFGNAIITTNVVAISERINNKMGIVIDPDNLNELENAIMTLINNEAKTKKYSEEAFDFANDNLNWKYNSTFLQKEMIKRGLLV